MRHVTAFDDRLTTVKIMTAGLLAACVLNAPLWDFIYGSGHEGLHGFPLGWLGVSLDTMTVFFHELGHAAAYWFYGYVALPHFDFQYGGGMTATVTGQLWLLNAAWYLFAAYVFYIASDHPRIRVLCVALVSFHAATAYIGLHQVLCIAAGPLAQCVVGGILVARAWLDWPGRGAAERFFSAAYGFGMLLTVLLNGWALIHHGAFRSDYFEQKGSHGFGDFDRISQGTMLDFSAVVWLWMICAVIAAIVPLAAYLRDEADYPAL